MLTTLKRLAFAGMFLLGAAPLQAQFSPTTPGDTIVTSPSVEGSIIKNVASASYSDINGNTYTSVKDSVSITVGFLAAPDPSGQASYSPATGAVNDTATFTLKNSGNGIDSATVASVTSGTGVTVNKYRYNGTVYNTIADLNAVIKLISLAPGASLPFPIQVIFSVASNVGGASSHITLTQASVRTPAKTAKWKSAILPPAFDSVSVTPDGGTIPRVVSNGAPAYTQTFTVTNNGNRTNSFSVSSSVVGPANGTVTLVGAPSPASTGALAPGASASITVSYTVAEGTAPDKIELYASGITHPTNDVGDVTISISKASLTMVKTAHLTTTGPAITNSVADAVVPGVTFYYKLAVTNAASSADAYAVTFTDVLSPLLEYVSVALDGGTGNIGTPTITTLGDNSTQVEATLSVPIVQNTTRFILIGVKIKTVKVDPAP